MNNERANDMCELAKHIAKWRSVAAALVASQFYRRRQDVHSPLHSSLAHCLQVIAVREDGFT